MKIAIDASRIVNEKAGVGRLTKEIVKALLEIDQKNDYFLFFSYWRGDTQKRKITKQFEQKNVTIKIVKMPGKVKERLAVSKLPILNRYFLGADVYLAPTFLEIIRSLKIPQVVVIHDLSTYKYPEYLGRDLSEKYNVLTTQACRLARKVVAISESTKKDLQTIIRMPESKLEVIYPGLTEFPSTGRKLPASLERKSYILSVGTIEPRKNLIGLFKAYALLPLNLQEKYPLAIVGAKGWNYGETLKTFLALGLKDKVNFIGYVDDASLGLLYSRASLFVYPSMYEGFGLPVLEALSYNLPVITSKVSSLPEVAGKAAILVNPEDPQEIASAIQRLLEHQDEAKNLASKAALQAKKFNWQTTARKYLRVFENLV